MKSTRAAAAESFHQLHRQGLLLLTNAWDAGSARLFESLGAPAIATTSAAVAWGHGYADGNVLPVALLASTIAEISRKITVPLTVDMEGGYSSDPAVVEENVAMIIGAGAVGINLEDAAAEPAVLCAKIQSAKRAGERAGINLFVNARTDGYLHNTLPPEKRLEDTLRRAERYRAAGADGIFVPGVVDPAAIRAISSAVKLPLNILARAGLPHGAELAALGVRRLSAGSGISEVLFGHAKTLASDFLRHGISGPLAAGAMPYREINALMSEQ